ncbi:hypothetical protein LJR231_006283 [Phyllobacterium sp. LjRoot231]|uniref:hypothetical protein n=1 Tax=Phyllobacterium sp. LjRoot231 TaxID=3342289 RepID=UPI003ED1503F
MAIKFALKDTSPKSATGDKAKSQIEAKSTEPLASSSTDGGSMEQSSDTDLFEAKPADQKRKKKKW